jgi:hypothetical protein
MTHDQMILCKLMLPKLKAHYHMKKGSAEREKGFVFIVDVKITKFQIVQEIQLNIVFEKPISIHIQKT